MSTASQLFRCRRLGALWLALFVAGIQACSMNPPTANMEDGYFEPEIAYIRYTRNYWQVWLTDSLGVRHRQLTDGRVDVARISWSTARQALLCNRSDGSLMAVDLNAKQSEINLPMSGMLDAAWSPSGKQIAFSLTSTQVTDNNDLWVVGTDGGGVRKMTNQPAVVLSPDWDKVGDVLVYTLVKARQYADLWRIDLGSGSKEKLTWSTGSNYDPTFGAKHDIYYSADTEGNFDIWKMDSEGGQHRLTKDEAYDAEPSVSPTGDRFVFLSLRGGQKRLWVKDVSSENLRAITPLDAAARSPVWLDQ